MICLLFLLLSVAAGSANAQEPTVSARVDTNSFVIGGQIHLTVSVERPATVTLTNIGPADSLEGLEIVERGETERSGSGASVSERTRFTITAFDSGTYVIPPFAAWYTGGGDTTARSVSTGPIAVFVHGVEVDTAGDIREIKPPLGVPLTFMEMLPYIAGVLIAAGLVWLVSFLLKKRRRGEELLPGPPPRPADEVALEALRSLDGERLWQRGKVKEYHSAISDIVRTYIERRYFVPAMESTSDETLSFGPIRSLPESESSALKRILYRSDLVKFAKFIPEPGDNESSLTGAVTFVEQTRRTPDRTAAPAAAAADPGGGGTP